MAAARATVSPQISGCKKASISATQSVVHGLSKARQSSKHAKQTGKTFSYDDASGDGDVETKKVLLCGLCAAESCHSCCMMSFDSVEQEVVSFLCVFFGNDACL